MANFSIISAVASYMLMDRKFTLDNDKKNDTAKDKRVHYGTQFEDGFTLNGKKYYGYCYGVFPNSFFPCGDFKTTENIGNSTVKNLEIGKFYWMLPNNDPDGETWENETQPARYEGDDKWTCLGVEGVSDWGSRWIGDEIKRDK